MTLARGNIQDLVFASIRATREYLLNSEKMVLVAAKTRCTYSGLECLETTPPTSLKIPDGLTVAWNALKLPLRRV